MPTREFLIESRCLGKHRAATVFLPFNYTSARMYPIVFCTDGQVLNSFTQRIERDIRNLELGELVLVGVHSSRDRSEEYCLTQNEGRFQRHEQFFTDEVPDWLRTEFGLVVERNRTGVFGYSYGAAFALTMASRCRDSLGLIITERYSGHDFGYWESELPLAVRWGFPMDSLQKD